MSVDEDTELRDLVAQTLENNGVLGKIRAQLRASVFLALEEQDESESALLNKDLQKYLKTKDGQVVTGLVREFLQHFNLEFSLAVFDPESGASEVCNSSRSQLCKDLNIIENGTSTRLPLLSEVVKRVGGERASRNRLHSTEIGVEKTKKSEKIPPATAPKPSNGGHVLMKDDSLGSDLGDDAFFDDPIPNSHSTFNADDKPKTKKPDGPSGNSMSSLAGLPTLGGSKKPSSPRTADLDDDIKEIDKKIADLGFDIPSDNDDYEEDFDNSNCTTPVSKTPRSARSLGSLGSSHGVKSFEDDIDEDIEEDISVADDLLRSDNSMMDDLTTDRTVSPTEQSAAFDYIEDVIGP